MENGDLNWIVPGKFLAFSGPHPKTKIENGEFTERRAADPGSDSDSHVKGQMNRRVSVSPQLDDETLSAF